MPDLLLSTRPPVAAAACSDRPTPITDPWRGLVDVEVVCRVSHQPVYGAGLRADVEREGVGVPGGPYPHLRGLEAADFLSRDSASSRAGSAGTTRSPREVGTALDAAWRKLLALIEEIR